MVNVVAALSNISPNGLPGAGSGGVSTTHLLQTVLSIMFGIIGALAFLVIVISGFRYIASAGDPQKTANAKSGIIYALVGLVVALSAEAIIGFVLGNL